MIANKVYRNQTCRSCRLCFRTCPDDCKPRNCHYLNSKHDNMSNTNIRYGQICEVKAEKILRLLLKPTIFQLTYGASEYVTNVVSQRLRSWSLVNMALSKYVGYNNWLIESFHINDQSIIPCRYRYIFYRIVGFNIAISIYTTNVHSEISFLKPKPAAEMWVKRNYGT